MPCGLELLDDGRLIFFSKNTCKIYVTKLGHDYEDLEYRREESEGSKRFFGTGPANYVRSKNSNNYQYKNRGGASSRGRGGFSQRGKSTQGFVRAGQSPSTFGNSNSNSGYSAEPSELSDFSVASSYAKPREPDSGSCDGFTPFSETESVVSTTSRASVSSSRLNSGFRGRGRRTMSKI